MDAATVRRLVAAALTDVGLQRAGRSRWTVETEELTWFVRLDRGTSYSPWTAEFGVVVLAWPSDGVEHLRQDYALHGEAVPDSASAYRWNDHRSYFTAAFDHREDALPDDERQVAFAFMASDLAALFSAVPGLPALVAEIRGQRLGGFVHRRLREAAEKD